MLRSFDTPIKHRIRAEYRSFLRETVLRHKKPGDVKVLCLPGHEAVEIFDVYDRLGIPRENIYGVEWNSEAFKKLEQRKLGIHCWQGDVFDYLGYAGMRHLLETHKDYYLLLQRGDFKLKNRPLRIVDFEENGKEYMVEASIAGIPDEDPGVPKAWLNQTFDIIALDICGHIRAKVVNGLSTLFRAGLLRDRGVFTLTSLAMREHPLTRMLIQMALLMDALVRGTMWRAAHDVRPGMVKYPYESDAQLKKDEHQRTGMDALVVLLGFGNELFTELLRLYKLSIEGKLVHDMPVNIIFDQILASETDETAMIVRELKRLSYWSEESHMRTSFVYFRKAAKAIKETGSLMEVVDHLGRWLSAPVTEIDTPVPELPRKLLIEKVRRGEYSAA